MTEIKSVGWANTQSTSQPTKKQSRKKLIKIQTIVKKKMGKEISNQKGDQESAKINQHLNKQRNSPEKEARFFFTKLKERANRNQQFG